MEQKPVGWDKLDRAFERLTKWLLYIGAAVLIFVMLVAFVDVIIAKLFGSSIPSATEIITYCDVPLAYLGMAYTLLIGQMTSVDILFGRLSAAARRVLLVVYDAVGVGLCGFFGKLAVDNMLTALEKNTLSNPKGGFPIWPFVGVEALSWFMLALAFLFCMLRLLLHGEPARGEEAEK